MIIATYTEFREPPFFEYRAPQIEKWEEAAAKFQERVPELAESVIKLIERERKTNKKFIAAFADLSNIARVSINPNISDVAIEEMLIQHLLTERIFRNVFNNPDFANNNIIAVEIEKVIRALTSQTFSRAEFLKSNDYFYRALEETAATIDDFSQKQSFLNSVYERFFQGFSVKVADTHGIVYTPQSIVNFMVKSVEDILRQEFGKSLSDTGVHILDPFVGTGNFMIRVMQEIKRTRLQEKYASELHCNEVMLLPYYIASMNIEHTFYDLTKVYQPFEGICLVDTFELAEDKQAGLFTEENTARIERQKRQKLFVIIGNPPYNAGQVDENDNNRNRKYPTIDRRVKDTYVKDSSATLRNSLSDPYVKAIRFASDRVASNGEGIVAFVTNNSFINNLAFDGVRKHLAHDFDALYVLDLGGNTRKNPKLSGSTHNVFGIQVGVSINFFIRKKQTTIEARKAVLHYARVDENWRKEEKYKLLDDAEHYGRIKWQVLEPSDKNVWLSEGMRNEFPTFIAMGNKIEGAKKKTIFSLYSNAVKSNNDAYVYNFDHTTLTNISQAMVENFNSELDRWIREKLPKPIEKFLRINEQTLKWIRNTKRALQRGKSIEFDGAKIRRGLYRPFCAEYYYFERAFNEDTYQLPKIFPTNISEQENRAICVNMTDEKPFSCLMVNAIPNLVVTGGFGSASQCFTLFTYDEDGTNRRENITDWALTQFRTQYNSKSISKLDIFHYVYALLHHPTYRTTYAANLKRELPRIPYVANPEDFRAFVKAGQRLADLHVDYESQPEYKLEHVESEDAALDWRVERMKLSKDKTSIIYNDFLTLEGIPPEAFEYRLGNRSALEWIIDQYQVSTDKRSGITNDPNRADEPDYIVKLIGRVTTVSVETIKIVRSLPELLPVN